MAVAAGGFISVGGASTPEIRNKFMADLAERYAKVAGDLFRSSREEPHEGTIHVRVVSQFEF